MTPKISIKTSNDIRTDYGRISALTRTNPVVITVNGKEDTVLISYEDYQRQMRYIADLEAQIAVYSHLSCSLDDMRLGNTEPSSVAFGDILEELNKPNTL